MRFFSKISEHGNLMSKNRGISNGFPDTTKMCDMAIGTVHTYNYCYVYYITQALKESHFNTLVPKNSVTFIWLPSHKYNLKTWSVTSSHIRSIFSLGNIQSSTVRSLINSQNCLLVYIIPPCIPPENPPLKEMNSTHFPYLRSLTCQDSISNRF